MTKKESSSENPRTKRKYTRFWPEPGTMAEIDFEFFAASFTVCLRGLVVSEAHGGCSIVLHKGEHIKIGDMCQIKVGELKALKAEIRWITELDDQLIKVGFEYLE